jgi:hypothetical protein
MKAKHPVGHMKNHINVIVQGPDRAWFKDDRFRVIRAVAGLSEAGRSRYAGVTDPSYNSRCALH